jgi:membrane peptidoglycan carboxypeptidase
MELYINGIEFGPHTYGIVRAAKLYFDKPAKELTPLESAFLAANKPCPKCGHKRFTSQRWTPWWQERMVGIMKRMRKDGIISDEQFVAEAPYVPRFVGWPQTEATGSEPDVGGVEE